MIPRVLPLISTELLNDFIQIFLMSQGIFFRNAAHKHDNLGNYKFSY